MSENAYTLGADVLAGKTVVIGDSWDEELDEVQPRSALQPAVMIPGSSFVARRVLLCELPEVDDDELWTIFVLAMKTSEPTAISASYELGMFGMKPRRLADLGLMKNVKSSRSASGRLVWIGEWTPPLSEKKFLSNSQIQYRAFCESMKRYVRCIMDGLVSVPEDMTLSGALAVLHKRGPKGLETWGTTEQFPATVALFERVNGIF